MRHLKQIKKVKQQEKEKGFTLVELLISLMLILVALLFILNIIVFSIDGSKKSYIRLQLSQKSESYKNVLLSKPFDSMELQDGQSSIDEAPFKIYQDIISISPTLKRIKISIFYKSLSRQIYFYKSKYIKEVKND
jgi:prepilin-type N-terminal cleavage/methylation domain-containing protein